MPRTVVTAAAAALAVTTAAPGQPVPAAPAPAGQPQIETAAPIAYLIDLSSGAELLVKNADQRMPPASMAKMMTTEVAFELIDRGELKLDRMCTVRPETWQRWHGPVVLWATPERPDGAPHLPVDLEPQLGRVDHCRHRRSQLGLHLVQLRVGPRPGGGTAHHLCRKTQPAGPAVDRRRRRDGP